MPPSSSPTTAIVAPHVLRYLVMVADEHGVDIDRAVRAAGLSRELLATPGLLVSYRQGQQLVRAALELIPNRALGLIVGMRQPVTALGVASLALLASPTLGDAAKLGVKFQSHNGSMLRWDRARDGGFVAVTAATRADPDEVDHFFVDEGFAFMTNMARQATGPAFRPTRVELTRPTPTDAGLYKRTFGPNVVFGAPRNAWMVTTRRAAEPLPTADAYAFAEAMAYLAQTTPNTRHPEVVATLSTRVASDLPLIRPLAEHARDLALSERTLRRRLADAGTNYSDVVDAVRESSTARLLERPELTLSEISAQLGYTDERSLRRAVRRWFGRSPAELRRQPN